METCKSVWYFLRYSAFKSHPSFSMTLYMGVHKEQARSLFTYVDNSPSVRPS